MAGADAAVQSRESAPTPVLSPHERSTAVKVVAAETGRSSEPEDDAAIASEPSLEDQPPVDEAAESAFLAEARERGEVVAAPTAAAQAEEAEDARQDALPALDQLVERIPAEVRDTLEELFRARFVKVRRIPKKALK